MKLLALLALAIAPAFAQTVEVIPLTPQETALLKQAKADVDAKVKAANEANQLQGLAEQRFANTLVAIRKAHGLKDSAVSTATTGTTLVACGDFISSAGTISTGRSHSDPDKDFKYLINTH